MDLKEYKEIQPEMNVIQAMIEFRAYDENFTLKDTNIER